MPPLFKMDLDNLYENIRNQKKEIENQGAIKMSGTKNGIEHIPVEIVLSEPSIGPSRTTSVTGCGLGFDWDAGKFLLFPEENLVTENYNKADSVIKKRDNICYCSNCTTIISEHDKYCRHCGKKLVKEEKKSGVIAISG